MKNIIIRLNDSNSLQTSREGVKINKLVSSISPETFIRLLQHADNKVNPRNAKVNSITKSINETLETSPELFWLKSKGILLATEFCKILERNRVEISLDDLDHEGIMDGGHNTLAIAIYLIDKLFDKHIKEWPDCKLFWEENYDEILSRFELRKEEFKFSIPIEIITPNSEDGALEDYYDYISEICSARNNNVQLKETAKGNQVGFYDHLKELLDEDYSIIWKTGDSGQIKSEDVISLATLPLIYLKDHGVLPEDVKGLNKINVYSQKSRCIDFFNAVMKHDEVSEANSGKYSLTNSYVRSGLALTSDILEFFDKMYINFPELYHQASPGKFGRISAVNNKAHGKAPFHTTNEQIKYQYPFGFFYPIVCGLTALMEIDEKKGEVKWRVNPVNLDLFSLDLGQYVNIIKLVNFDPQKVGKTEAFYIEADAMFAKVQ